MMSPCKYRTAEEALLSSVIGDAHVQVSVQRVSCFQPRIQQDIISSPPGQPPVRSQHAQRASFPLPTCTQRQAGLEVSQGEKE